MMVVWFILNMPFLLGVRILKEVKKIVNFKIFVHIMRTMKFVKWLGIDSDMLKLSEKIMNNFLGGDLQYLETPLKINTFHHILDGVHISGKDWKKIGYLLMIFYMYTCRIWAEMVSWRSYHCSECKKSHIVKLQVVRFQIPKSTQSTTFNLYDTGKFEVGGN